MKRVATFFVVLCILFSAFKLLIVAETASGEVNTGASYECLDSNAVNFTCNYSSDAKKIEIRGNINYNILVSYGKHKIEILRIAPNQTVEQAIVAEEPDIAASMEITSEFEMSFSLNTSVEKFYKYAVLLCSPDGERILASEPQYVYISRSGAQLNDNSAFKGISPTNTYELSLSGDMGFGSAIIPVYYDRLINESRNGYIYPHEDTHVYFDKAYIDELDTKIRTHSASGARVYIQLLLNNSNENTKNAEYLMPEIYDSDILSEISTYIRFLASRYDNYRDGIISGIIAGKQIDRECFNYNNGLSLSDYAEKYAFYLTVISNSARLENADIDVFIPVSNRNTYGATYEAPTDGYASSQLLNGIFSQLDVFFADSFECYIMLESDTSPIEAVSDENNDALYRVASESNANLGINNLSFFEAYLENAKKKFRSAPEEYIYFWSVPENLFGNMLECAYAYSYYALIQKDNVKSFVVSLSKTPSGTLDSVSSMMTSIDTVHGEKETDRLLKYFGVNEWKEIIGDYSEDISSLRTVYSSSSQNIWEYQWKGSFSYFDFSTGGVRDWFGGAYSDSVRTDYGTEGQRVLRQGVKKAAGAAHSDIYCLYEFDENFIYTPAIKLVAEIIDSEENTGSAYEITVTIGTYGSSLSESYVVSAGQRAELWLDMSEYNSKNKASYIKISTRSISGIYDEYSLRLYDIIGYSGEYDDTELNDLITEERLKIRNQSLAVDDGASDDLIYWIIFSIVLFAICIGGIMLTVMRKDDTAARGNRERQNKD